jgi:hypothetical protein
MASSKLEPRMRALLALTSLGLAVGCYSTTPHRVQVATWGAPVNCANAIDAVFSRSGYVQGPTPPHASVFFTPRTQGPYTSFLPMGTGVAVLIHDDDGKGTCHLTLEALSSDATCAANESGPSGTMHCLGTSPPGAPSYGSGIPGACAVVPQQVCELTSAPSTENDATVDELARRLARALGPSGRVN